MEHPKSKSTKPSLRGHGTPCTSIYLEVLNEPINPLPTRRRRIRILERLLIEPGERAQRRPVHVVQLGQVGDGEEQPGGSEWESR